MKHGINKSVLGLNMAVYSSSMIVATLFTGNILLNWFQRMNVLFVGVLFFIVHFFWSGSLDIIENPDTIVWQSYAASVFGGLGNGMLSVCVMAIICSYKENR